MVSSKMQGIPAVVGAMARKASIVIAANNAAKADMDRRAMRALGIAAVVLAAVMPELAMAAPWDSLATSVLGMLTGGLTRTVAIIAVIACGFSALAGKMSWTWAINVGVGIVLIFGSAAIVDYLVKSAS